MSANDFSVATKPSRRRPWYCNHFLGCNRSPGGLLYPFVCFLVKKEDK